MEADDIISYDELATAEKARLQKGMNFRVGRDYSVLLMSLRANSPYEDEVDVATGQLIYEGHDAHKTKDCPSPKEVDQPLTTPKGSWTENGKFFKAATDFASGEQKKPELVKVYEKLYKGIWCYKGFFELVGAEIVSDGKRKVCKFRLQPVEKKALNRRKQLPVNRMIPSHVKIEVWKRDKGQCVQCGTRSNLHFDHVIPFSKGGSSLTADNIRLLCAKHNLQKSDRIMLWVA